MRAVSTLGASLRIACRAEKMNNELERKVRKISYWPLASQSTGECLRKADNTPRLDLDDISSIFHVARTELYWDVTTSTKAESE